RRLRLHSLLPEMASAHRHDAVRDLPVTAWGGVVCGLRVSAGRRETVTRAAGLLPSPFYLLSSGRGAGGEGVQCFLDTPDPLPPNRLADLFAIHAFGLDIRRAH